MPKINVSAVLSGLTFSFIPCFPSWLDRNETKLIIGLKRGINGRIQNMN